MASSILSNAVSANALTDIAKLSQSASYDDILVLILVFLGSIGYLLRGIVWHKQDPYHHVWFERPQESETGARQIRKRTRNIAEKLEEAVSALPLPQSCNKYSSAIGSIILTGCSLS